MYMYIHCYLSDVLRSVVCFYLLEKATNYKDDGNVNFKKSKYRWAIDNYTVAIQCRCPDKLLNAVCYTNRAAAQYRLGECYLLSQSIDLVGVIFSLSL